MNKIKSFKNSERQCMIFPISMNKKLNNLYVDKNQIKKKNYALS